MINVINDAIIQDVTEDNRQFFWDILLSLYKSYSLARKDLNTLAPYFLEKPITAAEEYHDLNEIRKSEDYALKFVHLATCQGIPTTVHFSAMNNNKEYYKLFEKAKNVYYKQEKR